MYGLKHNTLGPATSPRGATAGRQGQVRFEVQVPPESPYWGSRKFITRTPEYIANQGVGGKHDVLARTKTSGTGGAVVGNGFGSGALFRLKQNRPAPLGETLRKSDKAMAVLLETCDGGGEGGCRRPQVFRCE
jgi:hypothetical protein